MRNRKHDIEKYLRGELSPAEMHALEMEALKDPFLAEALEGIEHAGTENFLFDLHKLSKSVHHRAGSRVKQNRTIKMGWTLGIAASVLLLAVAGFLIVTLVQDQNRANIAMKESGSSASDPQTSSDTITLMEDKQSEAQPEKQSAAPSPSTARQQRARGVKPNERSGTIVEEKESTRSSEQNAVSDIAPLSADEVIENAKEEGVENIESDIIGVQAPDDNDKTAPVGVTEEAVPHTEAAKKMSGLAEAKTQPPAATRAGAVERLVTGTVTSAEDGEVIPGANVFIKGTNIGVVTDARGRYKLPVAKEESKLVVAFIGYESQEISVGEEDEINVAMPADAMQLSEVVVTGYGQATSQSSASFRLAEPVVGRSDFKKYLSSSVKYPADALKNKVEGKVTIRFTVLPDGKTTGFSVVKGIGYGCDEELIRLVKEGPVWKPSLENDQPVADEVKVRFRFELPRK